MFESIYLGGGVFLESKEDMQEQQKDWDEFDPCKQVDFGTYPMWLTTDGGTSPKGYTSVQECKDELGSDFDHLRWEEISL